MRLLLNIRRGIGAGYVPFNTQNPWQRWGIDQILLMSLLILMGIGLIILYSASGADNDVLTKQLVRFGAALVMLAVMAQVPPHILRRWTPVLYVISILLLVAVLFAGHIGKGAQRWLNLGLFKIQPSEFVKLTLPMTVAWYLNQQTLPPSFKTVLITLILIFVPTALTVKQPDLGTALMLLFTGSGVLLFAGLTWRYLFAGFIIAVTSVPLLWHYMHDYQQQRVLTFLNPERDPLGTGYHIIQSKIAIGSGGFWGKGWLQGTQSHLNFLPEHATDFIFAVCGEEFGFVGCMILISVYLFITARALYIAQQAQDNYTRLLASGLAFMFFISVFVNIGMVTGILPVVGLPLPLVSYGGTSLITIMASFGILMSIHSHRRLWAK